jgi:uncharacterized protein YbbC (DUF1343 family)
MEAIYLYPTLCLFEGTAISVGRGTDKPFQQWGHPSLEDKYKDSFRPMSTQGATHPPYEGQVCYGRVATAKDIETAGKGIQIEWILEMLNALPKQVSPWSNGDFFWKLYGGRDFTQTLGTVTASELRASWQPGLNTFMTVRKKYLLYKDFE